MIDISGKHSEEILKKMCEWVNADPDSVDWEDREWFLQHTWTAEQEQKFIDWVADFLIKHRYTRLGKKFARSQASMFVANYGWKTV